MRIAISALYIKPGLVGGIERLLYNALAGLNQLEVNDSFLVYAAPGTAEIIEGLRLSRRFRVRVVESKAKLSRFVLESFSLPDLLRQDRCQVVWFPNYFLPPTIRTPSVVTIADLQFRHLPHFFSLRKRLWLKYTIPYAVRHAQELVTISHWCAADIHRLYGRQPEVVYIGLPDSRTPSASERPFSCTQGTVHLLVIAQQYRHKNIPTVIRALRHLDRESYRLDIVGQRGDGSDDIESVITELGLTNVRVHGYVTREDLSAMFGRCHILLLPSLFEGFGIPVVEAMLRDVPVIVSDIPVLREITFGQATYVADVSSSEAWAKAVTDVTETLRRRGPRHIPLQAEQAFSARRTAEQYARLFHRAAG